MDSISKDTKDSCEGDEDCVVCHNCLHGNGSRANFCEKCGMPLTTYAEIAPFERIQSYGWFLQKLIAGRPSKIILWGTWLLCGPLVIPFVFFEIRALGTTLSDPLWKHILCNIPGYVCVTAYIVILYKVTRNYFRKQEVHEAEERDE